MCAFYRQLEIYTSLIGLVFIITLSFVVSECFVCLLGTFGLCHFVWLLFCLCRTSPPWITWMSQREQPDRGCKRKKQVVVLNRGNSAVSVESSAAVTVVHSPLVPN